MNNMETDTIIISDEDSSSSQGSDVIFLCEYVRAQAETEIIELEIVKQTAPERLVYECGPNRKKRSTTKQKPQTKKIERPKKTGKRNGDKPKGRTSTSRKTGKYVKGESEDKLKRKGFERKLKQKNYKSRTWPAADYQEQPFFNPITGAVQAFCNQLHEAYLKTKPSIHDKKPSLSGLCHEVLHHVLAYAATIKNMDKEEERKKENFLRNLEVCRANSNTTKNSLSSARELELEKLIFQNIQLYFFTNDLHQEYFLNYISNLNMKEVIKLSSELFGFKPDALTIN